MSHYVIYEVKTAHSIKPQKKEGIQENEEKIEKVHGHLQGCWGSLARQGC